MDEVRFFPPQAADYLIAVKGLPQSDPHDVPYLKGFALGIAVASRGADHLRNRPTLEVFDLPNQVRAGIYGRSNDTLPKRYFDDPLPAGKAKGHHIDRVQFQNMLDGNCSAAVLGGVLPPDYYAERGWDSDGRISAGRQIAIDQLVAGLVD